jgi:hypothetical protein
VDVVFLDFSRAFDSIDHRLLVRRLAELGVSVEVLNWIANFLTGRRQRVMVAQMTSTWTTVTSGVPQGSILGPLLFCIYISDIQAHITCDILKYADDIKLFCEVDCDADRHRLQSDIDSIVAWARRRDMHLNIPKCHVMHLGRRNPCSDYSIGGQNLGAVSDECDLGVWTSNSLSVTRHCKEVAARANRLTGFLGRSLPRLSDVDFRRLYTAIIRPSLDYAATVWCPWLRGDVLILENAQRRATRRLTKLAHLDYDERRARLRLTSLADRRIRGMLIETFKLWRGFSDLHWEDFFSPKPYSATRGHCAAVAKPFSRLNVRTNFFSSAVVDHWNRLPGELLRCETVNQFKNALDRLTSS